MERYMLDVLLGEFSSRIFVRYGGVKVNIEMVNQNQTIRLTAYDAPSRTIDALPQQEQATRTLFDAQYDLTEYDLVNPYETQFIVNTILKDVETRCVIH